MSARSTTPPADEPAGTAEYPSLAAALAAFQAALPTVHKGATGQVGQNRNYKYADLSDLNGAVLPRLGAVGLSFSCKPTISEDGRFVLAYVLRHVSGETDGGEWPLSEGSPQQIGSALTYARRYCLQAVTGVAPDEDDDGAAAGDMQIGRERSQQSRNGSQNGRTAPAGQQRDSRPPADEPAPEPARDGEQDSAMGDLLAFVDARQWPRDAVAKRYADQYSEDIRTATAQRLRAFLALAKGWPADELHPKGATNGAGQ